MTDPDRGDDADPGDDFQSEGDPNHEADAGTGDDSGGAPESAAKPDRPAEPDHPLDGNAVVVATAKASVGPGRLRDLLVAAAAHLATSDRRADYRRRFESVHEDDGAAVFLVPEGHWADVGGALGVTGRDADALRRAHEEHLRRLGSTLDRREEFEHALELREAVVVGTAGE